FLMQNFYSLSYDKNTDVATYISKLKNLSNRLNVLKVALDDSMIISKVLATLPEEFSHFASAWESSEIGNKTLKNLTARLIAEEMRIKARQPEEKAVAFKATGKKCYKCNKIGHFAKDCRVKNNAIGSTINMTNKRENMKNYKKMSTRIGVAKKNESMTAEGTGSVEFESCKLKEVVFIPELSKNLLSVNAITNSGGKVIFEKDEVLITNKNKTVLKGKKLRNGLFQVRMKHCEHDETHLTENGMDKLELWHWKMGHINYDSLKDLSKISQGLTLPSVELNRTKIVCKVCMEAKHSRTKFGEERTRAKRPLEIIHTDLCGPISPHTWDAKIRCDNGREYVNRNVNE
ncbi:Copia protein, partial [Cyphomyrmex costatus]